MDIGDYVERMIQLGVAPGEAARLAAELYVAGASSVSVKAQTPGAARTQRWRERHKASPNVTERHDVTEPVEASQSVTLRHKASQCDVSISGALKEEVNKGREEKKERKRGSKIPNGWTPSEEDIRYASKLGLTAVQIDREVEKFRNYWTAEGKTKHDWSATWRNWVLKATERLPQNNVGPTAAAHAETVQGVWVNRGSPQWQAWTRHRGGKEPYYHNHGRKEGAMFRTEWPPQASQEHAA